MKGTDKRLAQIEHRIACQPVAHEVATAALDHFRRTGALPESTRLAACVAYRIQHGFDFEASPSVDDYREVVRRIVEREPWPVDPVRDALIHEAVWTDGPVQSVAREVLRRVAHHGHDLTGPVFGNMPLPEFGSVAMHLAGIPECHASPPYEAQARRLFARLDDLRRRLPQGNRQWMADAYHAVHTFWEIGDVPGDDLVLECAIVLGELDALERHAAGHDVAALMAAFDAAACATPAARREAAPDLHRCHAATK